METRTNMGSRLEILLFAFALFTAISVADDSGLCEMIACGKGSCKLTSSGGLIDVKLPHCECQPGWKKPVFGVSLSFLPCVIPNCTFDASCSKKAPSSAPPPQPSPDNQTGLPHPCKFALCGGGSCQKTSDFGYRCNCEAGYENLLKMTAGPCVRKCSLGADCSNLGINVGGNASATPPLAQADTSGNKGVGKSLPSEIAMAVVSLCVLLLPR